MESGTNGLEKAEANLQSSYSIIAFPGISLPQEYKGLVLSRWMHSLRHGNEYFKLSQSNPYFKAYEKYIKAILGRTGSVVRIAVLSDDRDVALGWSVIEGSILHYVYVNYEQRNQGVGTKLVPGEISTISHLTKSGLRIWPKKLPNAVFNPFV